MLIFLIGMPGSGKSYWMEQLAEQLQYSAVDMDHLITEQTGKTIPELFAISEEHFREAERKVLLSLTAQTNANIVIATGGGSPVYKDNMNLMKAAGCVLYLQTELESLLSNVEKSGTPRPLLVNGSRKELAEKLSAIYRQRKEIYEQAHAIIATGTASLATFAQAIQQYLANRNTNDL
jgi:shikimate kinase